MPREIPISPLTARLRRRWCVHAAKAPPPRHADQAAARMAKRPECRPEASAGEDRRSAPRKATSSATIRTNRRSGWSAWRPGSAAEAAEPAMPTRHEADPAREAPPGRERLLGHAAKARLRRAGARSPGARERWRRDALPDPLPPQPAAHAQI